MSIKFSKTCQSCGLPIKQSSHRGTEFRGKKSPFYCINCFQNSRFTQPRITLKQMQDALKLQLKANKTNRILAWFLVRSIPGLKRWKKK